jgi:hypothetical protein
MLMALHTVFALAHTKGRLVIPLESGFCELERIGGELWNLNGPSGNSDFEVVVGSRCQHSTESSDRSHASASKRKVEETEKDATGPAVGQAHTVDGLHGTHCWP